MRVPTSTYRLQLTEQLDLHEAARRLPYLRDLGVDWVYLSPILAAEPGSNHGYDVVAHDRIDAARGGEEGFRALAEAAHTLGMGVLVDIVPNHVGIETPIENAWWWDLLRRGRNSTYAPYFDIDWAAGDGRLRIPVLGDDPEAVEVRDGEVRYHEHRFPLAPGTSTPEEQHYELVHWRVADTDLNYRRFFAVNTLAGVRVEEPQVFADTHVEIRRWFTEGLADGLRVDHPDGLRDPRGYLDDLAGATGGAYTLVEKILEPGERLPSSWATAGTTGYDVLGMIDRVLTDPAGEQPLDDLQTRLCGEELDWHEMVHGTKRAVADGILGSEVRRIVRELGGSSTDTLVDAVAELLTCFPVYRSYLPEGREHLEHAFAEARRRRPDLAGAFDQLAPVLGDPQHPAALRFQQTSGMVMAKGVEDCAFYRYPRLTSLNEVGGDPSIFSLDVDGFHAAMAERQRDRPHAMTASSTHDTKRGEDVRARIAVLAEKPGLWERTLERLLELAPLPDRGFGSLLWQAAVGAWPISRDRLHAYAEKAMREAGDRTTWTDPDTDYESSVHAAVDSAFDSSEVGGTIEALVAQIARGGWVNSLAAKLLTLTVPGVPDVYQGSELWEQSLVDPDNRRYVDLDVRAGMLDSLRHSGPPRLTMAPEDDGAAKLLVTHRALHLRRARPELFSSYRPVTARGPTAKHVVAFDRGGAVTVVTRLPVGLPAAGGWSDTALDLPAGVWRDVITGRIVGAEVSNVLAELPVALLVREDT